MGISGVSLVISGVSGFFSEKGEVSWGSGSFFLRRVM